MIPQQTRNPIILYDGVCGLCNRFVQFVLKRDRGDEFRFAAIQSVFARRILERHRINPDAVDTVYVVLDCDQPSEQLTSRSNAVAAVCARLGGIWGLGAKFMYIFPGPVRDWAYGVIAGHRYRWFGKYESCPLPKSEDRHKFLDVVSAEGAPPQ